LLLNSVRDRLGRLSHLWVDAGYQGRGKRWAEEVLSLSVEVVRKPKNPIPKEVAKLWAAEWAKEEGKEVNWQRLMPLLGASESYRADGWWREPSPGWDKTA
jgi:putative transposase